MNLDLILDSAASCARLGATLAGILPGNALVFLQGGLGAGKTTLARGYLHGLGYTGIVKSPTYTLVEPYRIGAREVFHFDLYRLNDPEELELLGIRDYLDSAALLLVEWPERGQEILPAPDLLLALRIAGRQRHCRITSNLSAETHRRILAAT